MTDDQANIGEHQYRTEPNYQEKTRCIECGILGGMVTGHKCCPRLAEQPRDYEDALAENYSRAIRRFAIELNRVARPEPYKALLLAAEESWAAAWKYGYWQGKENYRG